MRHMRQHRGGDWLDDDNGEQEDLTSLHSDDERVDPHRQLRGSSIETSSSSAASPHHIRNAVLCMLHRTEGVNHPAMSDYLTAHFPAILEAWHAACLLYTSPSPRD